MRPNKHATVNKSELTFNAGRPQALANPRQPRTLKVQVITRSNLPAIGLKCQASTAEATTDDQGVAVLNNVPAGERIIVVCEAFEEMVTVTGHPAVDVVGVYFNLAAYYREYGSPDKWRVGSTPADVAE